MRLRSSFLEMNEAVPRTSLVGLELACVNGMRLGKAVGQGQSFSVHRLWGGGEGYIISEQGL